MISRDAFIAANRFGLGPRPGEFERIGANPKNWLHNQVSHANTTPTELQNVTPALEAIKTFTAARKNSLSLKHQYDYMRAYLN